MRFKLDENLGRRGIELLSAAGHDVTTVFDQNLNQAPDTEIIEACRQEKRCLVTLDLDFGNPLRFNPAAFSGIAQFSGCLQNFRTRISWLRWRRWLKP